MAQITMPCRDTTQLLPVLQRGVAEFLKRCKVQGLNILVTETYRTIEYQNSLYAKGRTASGNIVTNCKGGESPHEYRYAFDICKNVKGHEYDDANFFKTAGKIWEDMGGEWGGSWRGFVDTPHFQFGAGISDLKLRTGTKIPDNAMMPWEAINNMSGNVPVNTKPVTTDEPSPWANDIWKWAKENKITDGTNPQGTATREQVAMMIYNALKK